MLLDSASKTRVPLPPTHQQRDHTTHPTPHTNPSTQQLRDPIYASTYDSVEKAIGNGQPIAGSLFWKWAIPVFQKQDPRGPYGVEADDTTMAYVKEHAQVRVACVLCWVYVCGCGVGCVGVWGTCVWVCPCLLVPPNATNANAPSHHPPSPARRSHTPTPSHPHTPHTPTPPHAAPRSS